MSVVRVHKPASAKAALYARQAFMENVVKWQAGKGATRHAAEMRPRTSSASNGGELCSRRAFHRPSYAGIVQVWQPSGMLRGRRSSSPPFPIKRAYID